MPDFYRLPDHLRHPYCVKTMQVVSSFNDEYKAMANSIPIASHEAGHLVHTSAPINPELTTSSPVDFLIVVDLM